MSEISLLQIKDVEAVLAITKDSFEEAWSAKDFHYFLTHPHRVAMGLFHPQKGLLCYFLALLVQGDLDIVSLATRSDARRQGLGRKLLQQVMTDQRIERAFLEVRVSNVAAQALYEGLGFKVMGTRKKYYGGKEDALQLRWKRDGVI